MAESSDNLVSSLTLTPKKNAYLVSAGVAKVDEEDPNAVTPLPVDIKLSHGILHDLLLLLGNYSMQQKYDFFKKFLEGNPLHLSQMCLLNAKSFNNMLNKRHINTKMKCRRVHAKYEAFLESEAEFCKKEPVVELTPRKRKLAETKKQMERDRDRISTECTMIKEENKSMKHLVQIQSTVCATLKFDKHICDWGTLILDNDASLNL